jgi:nucleotide-binding universal stress UspA family protein
MSSITSILAATDLSAPARHAAERAARLAAEHQASLTLLHVVPAAPLQDLRGWLGAGSDAAARIEHEAAQALAGLARELHDARHAAVHPLCRSGSILDQIDSEAQACHADLVVFGARGEGFLRRMAIGTTSERLLRRTARPVLVVRQPPREPYRRVLVGVDLSPWSLHAVEAARQVAPHARLMLLQSWQVPFEGKLSYAGVDAAAVAHYRRQARDDAKHQLHALAKAAGLQPGSWDPLVLEGDPSQRLLEQEQERTADLVVMGKHGRSVAQDRFLGSVTRHVLAEGSADVLVSTRHDT